MKVMDIVKPVCKGFVCGAVLAVLAKPFKLEVHKKDSSFSISKN